MNAYAIVSLVRLDGSIPTAGNTTRLVISDLKTIKGICARAARYANANSLRGDKAHKIEVTLPGRKPYDILIERGERVHAFTQPKTFKMASSPLFGA